MRNVLLVLSLWICWSTDLFDVSQGTRGWAQSRDAAAEAAQSLCSSTFGLCSLDYCEKL